MPYGADVKKLDYVYLSDNLKIAVLPEVMKTLQLKPEQSIDEETAAKIVAENERLTRFK